MRFFQIYHWKGEHKSFELKIADDRDIERLKITEVEEWRR